MYVTHGHGCLIGGPLSLAVKALLPILEGLLGRSQKVVIPGDASRQSRVAGAIIWLWYLQLYLQLAPHLQVSKHSQLRMKKGLLQYDTSRDSDREPLRSGLLWYPRPVYQTDEKPAWKKIDWLQSATALRLRWTLRPDLEVLGRDRCPGLPDVWV